MNTILGQTTENISMVIIDFLSMCFSVHGWDHVSQGLVDLGFVLMDSFGPRSTFGKIQSDINPSCHFSPMQKACQLGATILNEIFKVRFSFMVASGFILSNKNTLRL